ncbi:MAG TPA: response regulator [Aggregatilineaceae bacterium]|nr:response regulator [Aggregatilineaceae bacterium]
MTEAQPYVLVVDDDRAIRRFLRTSLTVHGYLVLEAENGQSALQQVIAHHPDIVILDLGLPDMDGVEVTRQLREWTDIPILILSVREHEEDKIAALDAGADDYLTKPFGVGELMARLRVALRHVITQQDEAAIFTLGDLKVDLARRVVELKNQEVQLTPNEYALLRVLIKYAGKVLTHHQLLREVWGPGYEQEKHLLRVNMSNLRSKLEVEPARPQYILTEPGVGYRLRANL